MHCGHLMGLGFGQVVGSCGVVGIDSRRCRSREGRPICWEGGRRRLRARFCGELASVRQWLLVCSKFALYEKDSAREMNLPSTSSQISHCCKLVFWNRRVYEVGEIDKKAMLTIKTMRY